MGSITVSLEAIDVPGKRDDSWQQDCSDLHIKNPKDLDQGLTATTFEPDLARCLLYDPQTKSGFCIFKIFGGAKRITLGIK